MVTDRLPPAGGQSGDQPAFQWQHSTKPTQADGAAKNLSVIARKPTHPCTAPRRAVDARIIHPPIYTHAYDGTTQKLWVDATRPTGQSIEQQHKHHTLLTAAPNRTRLASLSNQPLSPPARMSSSRRRPPPPPPAWTPEPWSDGETSALLDAWGPRHLRACGGALRPADWRACADAVTSRRAAAGRAPRTVDQCKNRLDYLKKRLRAERSRPKGAPPTPPPVSGWLTRLRALLHLAPSAPPGFAHRLGAKTPKVEEEEEVLDEKPSGGAPLPRYWPPVPKRPRTAVSLSPLTAASGDHPGGGGRNCTEVAAALDRLAGTYERVEAAKQREATRLEERRLEAMRDLEIERMRLLVDVAVTASVVVDGAAATATTATGDF
jgi:hypothetical protein|uniref:Myb/SANT-like DNA-binding domain-containing protein n=2 Tax=Zea mays TaxID=4577 RepID=A0A804LIL2_MAIZE